MGQRSGGGTVFGLENGVGKGGRKDSIWFGKWGRGRGCIWFGKKEQGKKGRGCIWLSERGRRGEGAVFG